MNIERDLIRNVRAKVNSSQGPPACTNRLYSPYNIGNRFDRLQLSTGAVNREASGFSLQDFKFKKVFRANLILMEADNIKNNRNLLLIIFEDRCNPRGLPWHCCYFKN